MVQSVVSEIFEGVGGEERAAEGRPILCWMRLFGDLCLVKLENCLLYLRERVFISRRKTGLATRNEPKKCPQEDEPTVRLLRISTPLLARTRHRRVPIARVCPFLPAWSQPRRSGSVANPDRGNGGTSPQSRGTAARADGTVGRRLGGRGNGTPMEDKAQ